MRNARMNQMEIVHLSVIGASLVAQLVKNLPAMPCSIPGSGRSSGKGTATHSSILAWRILQTEEPGRL